MVIWATTILENPPYLYMTQDKAFLCPPCGVLNNPEPWELELRTIQGFLWASSWSSSGQNWKMKEKKSPTLDPLDNFTTSPRHWFSVSIDRRMPETRQNRGNAWDCQRVPDLLVPKPSYKTVAFLVSSRSRRWPLLLWEPWQISWDHVPPFLR